MARRRIQGFSLIELMVVVTIIGVSIVSFTPSFILAGADRRAASALAEVVRVGRRARSEAIGTQRAHLVWIRPGAGILASGIVQLLRGTTAHCDSEDWNALATCPAVGVDGVACLENLNLNDTHWFHAPLAIRLRQMSSAIQDPRAPLTGAAAAGSLALCYEPNGATQWAPQGAALNANPPTPIPFRSENENPAVWLSGAFLFTVGLVDVGTNRVIGVPRVLSYPLGTTPRRLR